MATGWQCIKLGTTAIAGIVPVAPWMIAAYLAAHPLPADCDRDCHFVIPAEEFRRGGMFGPDAKPTKAEPAPMPEAFAFAGDWAPDGLPTSLFVPDDGDLPGGGGSEGAGTGAGPRGPRPGGAPWPVGLSGLGPVPDPGTPLPRPTGHTQPRPPRDEPGPPIANARPPSLVAEPAAAGLLLAGLLWLAAIRRRTG